MALVLIVEDETLVMLLAESERPDLAFLDRNLGEGLTGIDVARKARQYNPDIHELYTSGDMLTDGVEAMFVVVLNFSEALYG